MLAPFAGLLLLVAGWPLARAVWWAVHDGQQPGPPRLTFTGHLSRMSGDVALWFALGNTLAFTVALVAILVPLALGLAMLLNSPKLRARGPLRALFFSTHLVGPVYVAGVVVSVAGRFAGGGQDPLSVPLLAMPIVMVAAVWMGVGWAMVYLLAALQAVDEELVDAARIDGAGRVAIFRVVTWPAIRPTVRFVALVTAVGGLQLFELPFVLFQGPGPGNAALTLSMYLFSVAFEQADLGYATAIGWVLAIAVTAAGAAAMRRTAETAI